MAYTFCDCCDGDRCCCGRESIESLKHELDDARDALEFHGYPDNGTGVGPAISHAFADIIKQVESLRARITELEDVLEEISGACVGGKRKRRTGKCDCDPCLAYAILNRGEKNE